MKNIIEHLEREAEELRQQRDAARAIGNYGQADMFGDRAAGFADAAKLLRDSGGKAFADCALPDDCECIKRGFPKHGAKTMADEKCLVPQITRWPGEIGVAKRVSP